MAPKDLFSANIKKRSDIDVNGFYDVIAHGSPNSIQIQSGGKTLTIDHRSAAKLFKRNPEFKGKAFRLLSCDTGASPSGFAQNLANKLNVVVMAPTKMVWAYPNGSHFVAGASKTDPSKPDKANKGRFIKFYPGGKRK
jgi:filamentous hemagglutinin